MEISPIGEPVPRHHDHFRAFVDAGDIKSHLVQRLKEQSGSTADLKQLVPAPGPARKHNLQQPHFPIKGKLPFGCAEHCSYFSGFHAMTLPTFPLKNILSTLPSMVIRQSV